MTMPFKAGLAAIAALGLSACDEGFDLDLRGLGGGFTTADAARGATERRPPADARGVISYPNYQVAVAQRGDTLNDVASRVGLPAGELSSFNGVAPTAQLRAGEIIALPRRVPEAVPAGNGGVRPQSVDVTTLAGQAIDNAPDTTPTAAPVQTAALPSGPEPIRHQVGRGETAFTIARLYQVPVRSLAEWNGLGSDLAVREGQFLLIPVTRLPSATDAPAPEEAVSAPGQGSVTPTPPSASQPLPEDDTQVAALEPPSVDVGETTDASRSQATFDLPVQGSIIRDYAKGRNEGIDIMAAPGTPVKAAGAGEVAAITESTDGVPIIVVRHAGDLLTVYANVTDVAVRKGDRVDRGQAIAKLRSGDDAFVHFEVRQGFESVDPNSFIN